MQTYDILGRTGSREIQGWMEYRVEYSTGLKVVQGVFWVGSWGGLLEAQQVVIDLKQQHAYERWTPKSPLCT